MENKKLLFLDFLKLWGVINQLAPKSHNKQFLFKSHIYPNIHDRDGVTFLKKGGGQKICSLGHLNYLGSLQ